MMKKLIKLLKKDELHGVYVKYSVSTAIENPQMILAEYNRIIKEHDKNINDIDNNDDYVVDVCDIICYDLNNRLSRCYSGYDLHSMITLKEVKSKIKNKYRISVHVKKLEELLKKYELDECEIKKREKELIKIMNERDKFKKEYL